MKDLIFDYVDSLKKSERLGSQVACHREMEPVEAKFAAPRRPFPKALQGLLEAKGISRLYSHQALALDHVRAGHNVVVATPTASGKTLTYNLPVIEQILADPESRALYVYPLKALAQDQLKAFDELVGPLEAEKGEKEKKKNKSKRPSAAIYDGDTSAYKRKKIRNNPPNVIMTNPEMIHLSMLPYHESWAEFFAGLTHVVIDEVHTYRGVLGSHMAQVLRRLLRVCAFWGARPTFVFCSATVANPAELCTLLTGLEVVPILENGAAASGRHMVFLNPHDSPAQAAIMLLQAALARGLRTIVYTQSRKMTELISIWAQERSGPYKGLISAYRAGFLPEERREIEARMSSGELLAVISTSALELGIDIGGLDVCILVGYPGSVMATLQRGGRVGRAERQSAVVLVAQEDALDQYFMRNPDDFFSRPPEAAVLNPHNPVILDRHLICAGAELKLRPGEPYLRDEKVRDRFDLLVARGELLEEVKTGEFYSGRKRPHRNVELRGAGQTMHIEDAKSGAEIGTIDGHRAFREAHPGAVYLHRGASWVVEGLDLETSTVRARAARVGYYTRVRGNKDTEILEIISSDDVLRTRVCFGRLKVTEQITGYEKRSVRGGKRLGIVSLDLPPLVFETEGLWFDIPARIRRRAEDEFMHFMGGIHAVEHAAIGMLPLLVMTDRNDLGGISTPLHPQTGGAAVFIYDGMPGGAGLTRQAFGMAEELLLKTFKAIVDCPCELGCPSCVHSPKCGSGNRPIDKAAAGFVLERIISDAPPGSESGTPVIISTSEESDMADEKQGSLLGAVTAKPQRFAVLDIETRRSAHEVGGWNKAHKMGVSVSVVYDSERDEYFEYEQERTGDMAEDLAGFDLVIGFNLIRFDYKVLSGVVDFNFNSLPTLDLLVKIHEILGYRVALDNLARATLDAAKSADGLQALKWWQEGRLDLITEYCRQDVKVTKDLYLFGRDNGHVLFTNKAGQKVRLPVSW